MLYTPIKQEIVTTEYRAVRLPAGRSAGSFDFETEDEEPYMMAWDDSGTDEIKVNIPKAITQYHAKNTAGAILFYAKAITATTKIVGNITRP